MWISLGGVDCYAIVVLLLFVLLDAHVYLLCLASRATCCCVFELIFSLPAGYLNPCALSYLLVSRFSLGYCRAVCFVALLMILVENILGGLSFGCGWVVSFWHCINFLRHFPSSLVSATSSYRWYSSYIKSTIMVACLWCRIGCLFLLLLLWCCYLLVALTAIFCWLGLLFRA
jgi:hypothetical protein